MRPTYCKNWNTCTHGNLQINLKMQLGSCSSWGLQTCTSFVLRRKAAVKVEVLYIVILKAKIRLQRITEPRVQSGTRLITQRCCAWFSGYYMSEELAWYYIDMIWFSLALWKEVRISVVAFVLNFLVVLLNQKAETTFWNPAQNHGLEKRWHMCFPRCSCIYEPSKKMQVFYAPWEHTFFLMECCTLFWDIHKWSNDTSIVQNF